MQPARTHLRLAGDGEPERVLRLEGADLGEVVVGQIATLGRAGIHDIMLEVVVARAPGGVPWAYGTGQAQVEVPAPVLDLAGADRALRSRASPTEESRQVPTVVMCPARCANHGSINDPNAVTPMSTTMAIAAIIIPYSTTSCPACSETKASSWSKS
jgi:hypothetical protein